MKKYSFIPVLFLFFTLLLGGGIVLATTNTRDLDKPINKVTPIVVNKIPKKPEPILAPIPDNYVMPMRNFVGQTFNNCGPAALSMTYSLIGVQVSQEELAEKMRPFNNPAGGVDDKSVFPDEFITEAESRGYLAIERPNGTNKLLERMVANEIPVIVRTWLNPVEDIGHFRVVRGYDSAKQNFIVDDSYNGPNLVMTYDEFNSLWKPFNYGYIAIYPKEKIDVVNAIVGEEIDKKVAYRNSLERAKSASDTNPDDYYAKYNMVTSYYHLGQYEDAINTYESVADSLPGRMFWYQLEPIRAYQKTRNYEKVFEMTDSIINNDNKAYSELYEMRGQIYVEQGNKEAARAEYEKAIYYNKNFASKIKLD